MLATHVGGDAHRHRHGGPRRVAKPARYGWYLFKWLTSVEAVSA
ncbi:MAG: molybdopterin-dependent oxidoreductase [Anaerolineales bacterium]|nr:molybdopterin-dependent oxidoreductase [Anaerolineales bacterium]